MRTLLATEDGHLVAAAPRVRGKSEAVDARAFQALGERRTASLSPNAVRQLQRSAGNQAVAALMAAAEPRRGVPVQRCTSEALCGPCAEEQGVAVGQESAGDAGTKDDAGTKEKGAPVSDDQVKTKDVPVAFEASVMTEEPPADVAAKAKACPPAAAAVKTRFPEGRSTAAQIGAMDACTWGITAPDDLKVTTRTCEDGAGNWTLRVTGVTSKVRTFSRLLSGQREATTGRSTSGNFCAQVHELDVLGTCGGAWYMLSAVKAHERVHVGEWKSSFPTDWPTVRTTIEGLTVPKSGATKKQAAATNALRSSAGFTAAVRTGTANFPTFWGIPDPNANTDAAERALVDPRITAICNKAKTRKWSPGACAECNSRGIV